MEKYRKKGLEKGKITGNVFSFFSIPVSVSLSIYLSLSFFLFLYVSKRFYLNTRSVFSFLSSVVQENLMRTLTSFFLFLLFFFSFYFFLFLYFFSYFFGKRFHLGKTRDSYILSARPMEEAVGEWPFIVFAVELTLRPKEFLDNDNDAICYFIVEPLGKYETMGRMRREREILDRVVRFGSIWHFNYYTTTII